MAEKRKGSLIKAFAKAAAKVVVGLVLGAGLLYGGWIGANYTGRGEKLTPGETQMVQQVFGPEINASKLRKHFRGDKDIQHCVAPGAGGMVLPPFSHIDFYGPENWSRDYSKDGQYKYGFFMHEATHTWQGQHLAFSFRNFGVYAYTLDAQSKWRDFGVEQQADIVEDYSKRWLYPANVQARHSRHDALLARVVESRFPQAHKTRLALEGNHPVNIDEMIGPVPTSNGPAGHKAAPPKPKSPSNSPYTFPFLTLCK